MSKRGKKRRVVSELNITNLVDVTFALLIIFMITAPMMTQGVQVDLPKAEADNVEVDESIQISINSRNEIFIDQDPVQFGDFDKSFRAKFANRKDVPVFVNADKQVPYGLVIKIISFVQNAGVIKLGFLTTPIDVKGK